MESSESILKKVMGNKLNLTQDKTLSVSTANNHIAAATNTNTMENGTNNKTYANSASGNLSAHSKPSCDLCEDRGIIFNGDSAVPCACMDNRKIENSFKYARISKELMKCRFESFNLDYYLGNSQDRENYINAHKALKAAESFTISVIDNPNEVGLLFTGPVGCGKTFLASAIANVLIEKQMKVLFLVVPDLLDELRASFNNKSDLTEFDLLDLARTVPILILDDLGAHNYTEWARNRIYTILNHRMNEQLPTIITTNLSFEEIEQHLGERTCSRLIQMCRLFRLSVDRDIRVQKYLKREGIK